MTAEQATEDVIKVQLEEVVRLNASGDLNVENIDVFCEKGVFDLAQTKAILQAGKAEGLRINFHGEELSCLGSAEVRNPPQTTMTACCCCTVLCTFSDDEGNLNASMRDLRAFPNKSNSVGRLSGVFCSTSRR